MDADPVNPTIPDKILLQIFDEYLFEIPVILPPRAHDERIYLMLACSRFHKLVISTPSLWFNAYFLPVLHSRSLTHAQRWLRLTAGVLVHLTFRASYSSYDENGVEVRSDAPLLYGHGKFSIVDDIIIPCIDRIRYLHTIISTEEVIRSFLRIPAGRFANLQQIDLILINNLKEYRSSFYQWEWETFSVFRGLKNLRKVGYHHYNGLSPLNVHFPWTQLTEVRVETVSLDPWSLLEIMHYTSSTLSRGFFAVKFTDELKGRDGKSKNVPRVRENVIARVLGELHLFLIHPKYDTLGVLHSLRLPSVVVLWIEMIEPDGPRTKWNLDSILPLICSISQLTIFRLLSLSEDRKRINSINAEDNVIRRGIPSQRDVEEFFTLMKPLRLLTLPISFCVHSLILSKMITGELLPILQHLEIASLCGIEVLLMVKERNENAVNYQLGEGPSDFLAESEGLPYAPVQISRLTLYVPHEDLKEIKEVATSLNQHYSCIDTEFNIRGVSHKSFYTMAKIG